MLSAVILTKNEERKIQGLIKSLSFASEIIVVDDYSLDKTVPLAKKFGARVYTRHLNEDFAAQRNFGLKQAKNNWVLFVDADEIIPQALANEIIDNIKKSHYVGFYIRRKGMWLGKAMNWGEWSETKILPKYGHNRLLRLGKKGAGTWLRHVHEYWAIAGPTGELKNVLIHTGGDNLKKNINSINFQARLHALANQEEGKKASLLRILAMPTVKFVLNFFLKLGFRDGTHGFVHAILMSQHSFLAWSQLYLKQKHT